MRFKEVIDDLCIVTVKGDQKRCKSLIRRPAAKVLSLRKVAQKSFCIERHIVSKSQLTRPESVCGSAISRCKLRARRGTEIGNLQPKP